MKPINSKMLEDTQVGFQSLYDAARGKVTPLWPAVAMEVPSSGAEEEYGWLGDMPEMREWLGDRVIHAIAAHGFRIKNKDFELTVGVSSNAISDDKLGVYAPRFSNMGDSVARKPDRLVFDLMNNGFAANCYDGQYFFDTDHPVMDEKGVVQSVSNFMGGSSAAWYVVDNSRPILPVIFQNRQDPNFVAFEDPKDTSVFMKKEFVYGSDARWNAGYGLWQLITASKQPLTADNYAAAVANLESRTGDYGKKLGLQGKLLVVGTSNKTAAKTILSAEQIDGTTNIQRDTAELLISPYLA